MTDRIKALEDALRPFSRVAGEMFARNWNRDDVAILFDGECEEIRLTFADFLSARAALAASQPASDCHQPDLVTADKVRVKPLVWEPIGKLFHAFDDLFRVMAISENPADYDAERSARILAALDLTPPTAQDVARVPEIAALIEAADNLLQNYLRDELDEPDLCVDDEHWSAIHDVNAALRAIAEGRA